MDWQWDDARLFLATAEAKSLSGAARALDLGQATLSRRIAQLEAAVGHALFSRSVSGVSLTDVGVALLASARTMHDGALAFESAVKGKTDELAGRVRFTAAPGVAVDVLAPFAAVLRREHPRLRLEVLSAVGHLDIARGEADIALRTREPRENELAAVGSSIAGLGVYAAPSYRQALNEPCKLEDLDWVAWAPPYEGLPPENWLRAHVPNLQPVFTADSYVAQERAARDGIGAILLPDLQAKLLGTVQRITLVPEQEKKLPRARVYIVVAKSALSSPRVRTVAERFVDWLEELSGDEMQRFDP